MRMRVRGAVVLVMACPLPRGWTRRGASRMRAGQTWRGPRISACLRYNTRPRILRPRRCHGSDPDRARRDRHDGPAQQLGALERRRRAGDDQPDHPREAPARRGPGGRWDVRHLRQAGVLLDIAAVRGRWLGAGEGVMPEDLEVAERAQGVRVEPGDILLIRTGYYARRLDEGPRNPSSDGSPAAHVACMPWFRDRGIAMLG